MQLSENKFFQVIKNNFNNISSRFYVLEYLGTKMYKIAPYYPKLSITKDANGITTLGVKISQGFSYARFKDHEFQDSERWKDDDDPVFLKQIPVTLSFTQNTYNLAEPLRSLYGFRSGLITCVNNQDKQIINIYNEDKKNKSVYKNISVLLIRLLPQSNDPEFIVLFEDSTAMRYNLNAKSHNSAFMKNVRKFEKKTSFDLKENKLKSKSKNKSKYFSFNCYLDDAKREFNYLSAINNHPKEQNPTAYYKFNHRDISDLVVRSHPSFQKTVLRYSTDNQDNMILALTSRDGYLVLYALNTMKPLLSYKTPNGGGVNALCFSENCELIALSGPDECITVLDLYTLNIVRCVEGHKAFISRAIFHTINVSTGRQDQDQENERKAEGIDTNNEMRQSSWMRIIGGGMDGLLSFWEFRTDIFGLRRTEIEESQLPLRLHSTNAEKSVFIKPIHLEQFPDAIGWVEIFENRVFVCQYDGDITYLKIESFCDLF